MNDPYYLNLSTTKSGYKTVLRNAVHDGLGDVIKFPFLRQARQGCKVTDGHAFVKDFFEAASRERSEAGPDALRFDPIYPRKIGKLFMKTPNAQTIALAGQFDGVASARHVAATRGRTIYMALGKSTSHT